MGMPEKVTDNEGRETGEWFINRDGTLGIQRALLILLAQAGTGVTS